VRGLLTFPSFIVITHSYLLIRDDKQPLELNVVDNYQADEIRSIRNLSGGESFIVSLTLVRDFSKWSAAKSVWIPCFLMKVSAHWMRKLWKPHWNHLPRIGTEGKNQHTDKHNPCLRWPQFTVRPGLYKGGREANG
jgi:hypothetical protein